MIRRDAMGASVPVLALLTALALLGCGVLWSLSMGQGDIPVAAVIEALRGKDRSSANHIIVWQIRMPRTLLAILVGSALAVAGALVQVLTRNPLAEPGILGATVGASFAIVVATALGLAEAQQVDLVVATLGAGAATALVYAVSGVDPLRLVLAGTALTALLMSLSLGIRLLDPVAFDDFRFWAVGSLAGRDQQPLMLPTVVVIAVLVVSFAAVRPLGAIELGDDVAHGLGVPVRYIRVLVLVIATILTGVATAMVGPIAFVGLIVPHLVRGFARGSMAWLLMLSLIAGPALLLAADTLGRVLLETGDAPVAIVTGVLGGPMLIWVVRREGVGGSR